MLSFKKCFSYPDHVEKYIVSCVRKWKVVLVQSWLLFFYYVLWLPCILS